MQKIDLRVDVRYQVLKGGDNGDLHAGHRIVPEKDGSLAVILVADNPLWWATHLKDIPAGEVDAALVGAEIDVAREWLATQGAMIVLYVLQHKSGYFFAGQNMYLGTAKLVGDIDSASKMALGLAEDAYSRMDEKEDWKIYQTVYGFRLGEESTRHINASRKAELEKELAKLEGL